MTSIEKKKATFRGLNLTKRTLLSIVKYFKKFDKSKSNKNQKFIYDDDYDKLYKFILDNEYKVRTLDVQIVDIADEIAYAAHDLEDGLRLKCFTIDEILHEFYLEFSVKDINSYEKLKEIIDSCRNNEKYSNTDSTEYSKLFRQELTSKIVNILINDIGLVDVDQDFIDKTGTMWDQELGFINYGNIANGLKKITFKCINNNDDVYHYEKQGGKVIEKLVEIYRDNNIYLSPEYRASNILREMDEDDKDKIVSEKELQERLICDYISGMMDSYAISAYNKFTK